MKKITLLGFILAILLVATSSCTTMKKDCQGNRHVKMKNGVWI